MLMRDVEIGAMVFLVENMDDGRRREIRETYYCRSSENSYRRHGLAQGDPDASEPMRVGLYSKDGYEYPLVGALPVLPISESRFYHLVAAAPSLPAGLEGGDADHYPPETPPSGELGGSDKREPRNSPAAPFPSMPKDPPELTKLIAQAVAAYKNLSPEQKILHDRAQRRSFLRGMCPSHRGYIEWCGEIDKAFKTLAF